MLRVTEFHAIAYITRSRHFQAAINEPPTEYTAGAIRFRAFIGLGVGGVGNDLVFCGFLHFRIS